MKSISSARHPSVGYEAARAPTQQRLTTNSSENAVSASAISPDGKYLAYADKSGIYLRLMATGEIHPLLAKGYDVTSLGWFPDSSQLFASWAIPPENKFTFGNREIRAWGAGGNFGWTLPGPVWRVRFGLQTDAISGDDGQPGTLGTLNAFFPRGAYFGPKFALIGPANLLSVQPQFVFHPLLNVTGCLDWIWFWRESTKDALYSFENVPLRPANLTNARYIGSQPNLEIRWAISEHFLAALNLAGFMTGTFLKQSPPSNAIVFVNVGLTYRF